MTDDSNKVVKLRQPQVTPAAGVSVDDPIQPKSLLNMSELEQEMLLNQLRDRRLRAAVMLKQANVAKNQADSVISMIKIEKKAEQVARQFDRASKAFDKLEEMLYSLRTTALQHSDVDITKVTDEPTKKR